MPKGPQGQKRPADVIGNAIMVGRIATGEIVEGPDGKDAPRKGGLKGGKVRAARLTPEQRKTIAKKASSARWGTEIAAVPGKKERQGQ